VDGGKLVDLIGGFPKDVYGKGPMYDIGPLGERLVGRVEEIKSQQHVPDRAHDHDNPYDALREIERYGLFDYVLVNEELEEATKQLKKSTKKLQRLRYLQQK
jgi:guanylate kinase